MKRYFAFITVAVAAIFLSACIGSGGSSAPAPNNVHVVAKDSRVIVTWDMDSGVEYWFFHANGSGVTPQNCSSMPLCYTAVNVTSPALITSLYDGYPYSFSINGRRAGGPGGPGSAAVSATPRLAGTTWTSDTAPTTSNLLGITYGAYDANGARFVAAGTAGALYSGTVYTQADGATGITWSPLTNPLGTTSALNAVNYDTTRGEYISVGSSGAIIAMTPSTSTTWAPQTSGTSNALFAVANSGANYTTVAVGASGTIIYTADGGATSWHAAVVPAGITTQQLNGITYGYSTTLGQNIFVTVGTSGTLLYSQDYGVNWLSGNCTGTGCTAELKGVTYGGLDASGYGIFVAVGASGTVLTSENGVDWTPQLATTISPSSKLNAVTYSVGRRFVAVAEDGNIYYSEYYTSGTTVGNGAVTWSQVTPAAAVAAPALYAITTGGLYDFSAVGASGTNQYAD